MTKAFRQAQIQKLVRSRPVHTQEELAAALASAGIATSQVTLSRDIRELGLVKTPEGYREPQTLAGAGPGTHQARRVLQEFAREVEIAQNLVVVKTAPGSASSVALALDRAGLPELVGTVAGDDTIFAAAPSAGAAKRMRAKLTELWRESGDHRGS